MAENTPNTPIRPPLAAPATAQETDGTLSSKVATVALVGLGAALIEVELVPGILLGVAAMAMPNLLPKLGKAIRPLLKETVRAGYSLASRAREGVA